MDRVLLVFDDLQYSLHLEMTLRKVGFDTETITNEYNLSEKLLTFNPDYIIVKGNSQRVSSMQIGKKLKDTVRYLGRVILIFPDDQKPGPEDLIKLRMDILLFEPISALRLVAHILSLTSVDHAAIMDKLLRIAHTDSQFRQYEQQILKTSGASIDAEIQFISGRLKEQKDGSETIDEISIQSFLDPNFKVPAKASTTEPSKLAFADQSLSQTDPEYIKNLKSELENLNSELPLRVASYNKAIKTVDQDLKKGLTKRYTKSRAKEFSSLTSVDEKKQRDSERIQFANALWKKK